MPRPKADNLTWHPTETSDADRRRVLGQTGCVVWLTGLSGSGKSTIARSAERRLIELGRPAYVLDGDNVRQGLNADLGFAPADRAENIRRVGEVAALLADAGLIALVSFISPYRAGRDRARSRVPAGRFVEVHVRADLATCEARDPKGLYAKARAGEIRDFTGIDAPYEPPERPELVLDTGICDVPACVEALVADLGERGLIDPPGGDLGAGSGRKETQP